VVALALHSTVHDPGASIVLLSSLLLFLFGVDPPLPVAALVPLAAYPLQQQQAGDRQSAGAARRGVALLPRMSWLEPAFQAAASEGAQSMPDDSNLPLRQLVQGAALAIQQDLMLD
jgi:hypothetical protein